MLPVAARGGWKTRGKRWGGISVGIAEGIIRDRAGPVMSGRAIMRAGEGEVWRRGVRVQIPDSVRPVMTFTPCCFHSSPREVFLLLCAVYALERAIDIPLLLLFDFLMSCESSVFPNLHSRALVFLPQQNPFMEGKEREGKGPSAWAIERGDAEVVIYIPPLLSLSG